ncbi:MAG: response regulator [Deltaproteobacteria bacterium]|nr:response regulator [Deltaproteobacteria bacterium]
MQNIPSAHDLPERGRLLAALRAELQTFGGLPPRPIWCLSTGAALQPQVVDEEVLLEEIADPGPIGWIPPIGGPERSPDARIGLVLARLGQQLGARPRWWRRSPLSGALHPADTPEEHAPLGDLPHASLAAGAPVWEERGAAIRCAWPYTHGETAGVLDVLLPAPADPTRWEELRRAAERLGAEEHRRAAEAVAARDRRYLDAVLHVSHDGVLGGTPDGRVIIYSARLEAMVGWTHAEVDQGAWPHRVYPDPEVRSKMIANIRAHFDDTQFEGHEVELNTRAGAAVPCRLRTVQSTDEHGQVVVIGAFQDITRARAAAVRAQQQANINALGHLAATIAHDFRNLLALVAGHAAVLGSGADGELARRAGRIRATAERGGALARRLLTFGSARPVDLQPVDLVTELERALEPHRGVEAPATLAAPPGPAWVRADLNLLHEVLDNLLDNAITAQGGQAEGIQLQVDQAPPPAQPSFSALEPGRPVIHLGVLDQGPGFSDAARAHLFQPFFSTHRQGHGLGLASVRQLVSLMSGAIDVPADVPHGRIDLWLPQSSPPTTAVPAAPARPPRGQEQVWVLDDEEDIGEIVSSMLTELGYGVRAFTDADAFLRAIDQDRPLPDALMLDLHIGRHSGLRLLEELRARGLRQPVLLCTGGVPPTLTDPRARLLEKPFDQLRLAVGLRTLIDHMVFGGSAKRPTTAP